MVANKVLTLAFVQESARILLGYKKTGFGAGRWNGFGGKVEQGETIEEAARREMLEESGLTLDKIENVGLLLFEFAGDPQLLEVHVFKTNSYSGIPTESVEMNPKWFQLEDIPFKKMWTDDILWFPYLLKGSKFSGYFLFEGMNKIINHKLHEVNSLQDIIIPSGPQPLDISQRVLYLDT